MEESEDKGRGFKVQDRRRFSPEGEAKADAKSDAESRPEETIILPNKSEAAAAQPEASPKAHAAEAPSAAAPGAKPGKTNPAKAPPMELTFAAFVWSLSEQALAALGEIPDPATGAMTRDLVMAQQMIDIIIMLRDRTRGNLDQHEQALVQEILSTLQMKYVELARQPAR
jgi:hypothetical protein